MTMLADFLVKLNELFDRGKRVDFHHAPQLPQKIFVRHGDQLLEKDIPPSPRTHKLFGLDDLVEIVGDTKVCPSPTVFIDGKSIAVVTNDSDRREILTMPLVRTPQLGALAQRLCFAAEDAAQEIYKRLVGCKGLDSMIADLQTVTFVETTTSDTTKRRGFLSRGKKKVNEMVDPVAEIFNLRSQLWCNPGLQDFETSIDVHIDIDEADESLTLFVLENELYVAEVNGLDWIKTELKARGVTCPVYLGTP